MRRPTLELVLPLVLSLVFLGSVAALAVIRWGDGPAGGPLLGEVSVAVGQVERRKREGVLFLPVSGGSRLHEGTLLRTGRNSSADLRLRTGATMKVGQLSMVRLQLAGRSMEFDLRGGWLRVDKRGSSQSLILKTKGGQVAIESGSISVLSQGGQLTMRVLEGRAAYQDRQGKQRSLEAGNELSARADGSLVVTPGANEALPVDGARIVGTGQSLAVRFRATGTRSFRIGRKPSLADGRTVRLQDGHALLELSPGTYYWQLSTMADSPPLPPRTFEVVSLVKTTALFPPAGARLRTSNQAARVRFVWDADATARGHVLEITSGSGRRAFTRRLHTQSTRLVAEFPPGNYSWRIVTDLPVIPTPMASSSLSFSVIRVSRAALRLQAPVLVEPKSGRRMDMTRRTVLRLRWSKVGGAEEYQIRIRQTAPRQRVVLERRVKDNSLVIRNLLLLDEGSFEVEIRAVAEGELGPAGRGTFRLFLSAPPGAPKVEE